MQGSALGRELDGCKGNDAMAVFFLYRTLSFCQVSMRPRSRPAGT